MEIIEEPVDDGIRKLHCPECETFVKGQMKPIDKFFNGFLCSNCGFMIFEQRK